MVEALTPAKMYGEVVPKQQVNGATIAGGDGRMTEEEVAECYAELDGEG